MWYSLVVSTGLLFHFLMPVYAQTPAEKVILDSLDKELMRRYQVMVDSQHSARTFYESAVQKWHISHLGNQSSSDMMEKFREDPTYPYNQFEKSCIEAVRTFERNISPILQNRLTLVYNLESFSRYVPSILSSDGLIRLWHYRPPETGFREKYIYSFFQWKNFTGSGKTKKLKIHIGNELGCESYFSLKRVNLKGRIVYFFLGRHHYIGEAEVLTVLEIKDSTIKMINHELGLPEWFDNYPTSNSSEKANEELNKEYIQHSRILFDEKKLQIKIPKPYEAFQKPKGFIYYTYKNGKFIKTR